MLVRHKLSRLCCAFLHLLKTNEWSYLASGHSLLILNTHEYPTFVLSVLDCVYLAKLTEKQIPLFDYPIFLPGPKLLL